MAVGRTGTCVVGQVHRTTRDGKWRTWFGTGEKYEEGGDRIWGGGWGDGGRIFARWVWNMVEEEEVISLW